MRAGEIRLVVRLFAAARERAGRDTLELSVPPGSRVSDALARLWREVPPLAALAPYVKVALNQEMVETGHPLADGDELALIPPVAGGSGRLARVLLDEAPSLDRCVAAVRGPEQGGIATFTGMVREHSQGKQVSRLEYEAYAGMADRVFAALCNEVEREWPGARCAIEHAVGALGIGDVAVVVAASAPHRQEAFAACRALIDRLKERAPIWKKEIGPDGASWVGLGP
jgi:molybdopterin synthase catalytic subunit